MEAEENPVKLSEQNDGAVLKKDLTEQNIFDNI